MACVADVETWVDLRFMDSFVSPEYMEPFFSDNLSFSVLFIGSDFPLLFKTIALHPFCVGRACVGEKVWRDLEAYLEISERTEYLLTKTKQGSVPCVETGIKFLKENYPKSKIILLIGGVGRPDNLFSSFQILKNHSHDKIIYLLGEQSLVVLLRQGINQIFIPKHFTTTGCGVLPFEPCRVTCSDLKYELENRLLKYGVLVSSSNEVHFLKLNECFN
eukprot:GHVP01069668.1.p1 GENE.GHVP01069668.1~~GHVP01069668.1.p1  ORF type:complete len:228 (+),score=22.45 GHVP01069668.1:31-684(+)